MREVLRAVGMGAAGVAVLMLGSLAAILASWVGAGLLAWLLAHL